MRNISIKGPQQAGPSSEGANVDTPLALQASAGDEGAHSIDEELHLASWAVPVNRRPEDYEIGVLELLVDLIHPISQGAKTIPSLASAAIEARQDFVIVEVELFA